MWFPQLVFKGFNERDSLHPIPELKFTDNPPASEPFITPARYTARITSEKDTATIWRSLAYAKIPDLQIQISNQLTMREIERCLMAILEDVKQNGLYTLENAGGGRN